VAHDLGIRLASLSVQVTVSFAGRPLLATGAAMRVNVVPTGDSVDVESLIRRAREISTVSNSVARGIPVEVLSEP